MSPRAPAMSTEERRVVLVDATLRLLREHGRAVTTKQIAEAAGVAEGTIFRVVETKDELVHAAIARAFEPGDLAARIAEIDLEQPLEQRLLALTAICQQRFRATFSLMHKVGLVRPPDDLHDCDDAARARERITLLLTSIVEPDRERLAVPVDHFVHVLRLLTFAGSHPHITDDRLLSPEEIVATVLHGLLREER